MTLLSTRRPATILKRIIAGLIDYAFIWLVLWWPVHLLVFGDIETEMVMTRSGIGTHFSLIRNLVLWLFPFCLRDVFGGRGLGKWIVGIRVVDAAGPGSPPSIARLIVRNVTIWLSPVGMVSAAMDPDRMRFGDRLAGTMVVEETFDPRGSALKRRLLKGVVLVAAVGACWLSIKHSFTRYMTHSGVHEAAMAWIDGYEPLQEVVRPLRARQMVAVPYGYRITPDNALAAMGYYHQGDNLLVALGVAMVRRDDADWHVEDVGGEIRLKGADPTKERIFGLNLRRGLHRFLTEEEMRRIRDEKQPPDTVIPELREPDNVTAPTTTPPGEPPAGDASGKP